MIRIFKPTSYDSYKRRDCDGCDFTTYLEEMVAIEFRDDKIFLCDNCLKKLEIELKVLNFRKRLEDE